jgi:hypothetical protein
MTLNSNQASYSVLNPWAVVDPVALRGLTAPRPTTLEGKTIGLFHMWKRASKPILDSLEKHLKDRFPTAQFSWYAESVINTPEILSPNKSKYEAWLKVVDAVVFTDGD